MPLLEFGTMMDDNPDFLDVLGTKWLGQFGMIVLSEMADFGVIYIGVTPSVEIRVNVKMCTFPPSWEAGMNLIGRGVCGLDEFENWVVLSDYGRGRSDRMWATDGRRGWVLTPKGIGGIGTVLLLKG